MPVQIKVTNLENLTKASEEIRHKVFRAAQRAAEEGLNEAKAHHSYIDRTGNLTHSMGMYSRLGDAAPYELIESDSFKGADYLNKVEQMYKDHDMAVAITAGMEYAGIVASRGYTVLEDGERVFLEKIKTYLSAITSK